MDTSYHILLKVDTFDFKPITQEERGGGCSQCWWRRRAWSWAPSTPTPCSHSSSALSASTISPLPSNSAPRWNIQHVWKLNWIQGHLVCIDCFPRLPHCPTCRSPMAEERNLGMEQVRKALGNFVISTIVRFPDCWSSHAGTTRWVARRHTAWVLRQSTKGTVPTSSSSVPSTDSAPSGALYQPLYPTLSLSMQLHLSQVDFAFFRNIKYPCACSTTLWNPLLPCEVLLQEKPVELHLRVGQEPVPVHGEAHPLLHRRPAWEL